jgi:6-phosphogluconolactonase/glucosamine-6-phosphate isomerase/deaminase
MHFLRESSDRGAKKLAEVLLHELKHGKTVLWFISGGSNIKVAVQVMHKLLGHEDKLIVTPSDERYGPLGHKDSNWQQLLEAGFEPCKATVYPVLQEGLSLQATARMFELTLHDCFVQADTVVALLGMGSDGHASGILPQSPATKATDALVVGYETRQYDRITTTFTALKQIDTAFCLAYGADKKPALLNLRDKKLPLDAQPAQILKDLNHAYVYNDQIEEKK